MTKEQTNEEINGKEMPLVSTFSLQDLIDEAVSQEKEKMIEEIRNSVEVLADIEHTRWSKWQEYFFSKCKTGRIDKDDKEVVLVLPRSLYDRWWLQINTLYSELSEAEKESDRKEARNSINAIIGLLQNK